MEAMKRESVDVFDSEPKRFKTEDGVADITSGLATEEVLTIIDQSGGDDGLEGQPSDLGAAVDLASVTLDESGMVSAGGDAQALNELGLGEMPTNIIIQHMDIAEPLSTLRALLEDRLGISLADHEFVLTDTLQLDINKNLVEQCVQGEGVVQINVEIKSAAGIKRVNIVDILKPAEDFVAPQPSTPTPQPQQQAPAPAAAPQVAQSEHVTRWIVDQKFRKEQEQLGIPFDPADWSVIHVKHWIKWAVREFQLAGVQVETFNLTGAQLCALKHDSFVRYIPHDPGDVFWTHLELLRKCKFVAVVQQPAPQAITTVTVATSGADYWGGRKYNHKISRPRSPRITGDDRTPGNRSGNNGQIQLWQFLLELLTDRDCREVIQWLGDEGEFKLMNPELVAQLWGARKNKPTMNYEKLSRALRYYYDGDMIAKVHGKKFVYKFICDLRALLGYSAGELGQLVIESSDRKFQKIREMHNLLKKTQ